MKPHSDIPLWVRDHPSSDGSVISEINGDGSTTGFGWRRAIPMLPNETEDSWVERCTQSANIEVPK